MQLLLFLKEYNKHYNSFITITKSATMKTSVIMVIATTMFITTISCKSKTQKDAEKYMAEIEQLMEENPVKTGDKQQTNDPPSEMKEDASSSPPVQDADIIGEWEMVGYVLDTNGNLQIDEEERKNLKPMSFKDYMKLNSDGTGLFTSTKLEGRYEAKPREKDGKKFLTWYDSANGRHRVGTIMKVTKNEMHIKERDGHGLFIWKRL